ncbi:diguanylate cyclase (GGDEF) domain-containing protein [Deinococcus reticulitermitis]|uniref:Diguanylate cyclase (GGDEF) domain-containing protein n=1 Tax=Deinococcus reticulitermitis TaxID=856736 RepID=A0A1H6XQQ0_9DEIO|nr:sensor domain-containing diguanylate cyclase [Deinococcus reticulitermitis]SEJ31379.1 diguanylate cyclase (GGDEF) domain-containing protein [Deinococcus reticulitermitis]
MTATSPYERLLPTLLVCRTLADLHAALVKGLAQEWPGQVALGTPQNWALEWRGEEPAPEAFGRVCQAVDHLRAVLGQLERSARLDELALKFMGRGTDPQAVRETLERLRDEFSLTHIQVLRDQWGGLRPEPLWALGAQSGSDGPFEPLPPAAFSRPEVLTCRSGQLLVRSDGLLLPVGSRWRPRLALWFAAAGRTWPGDVQRQLMRLGRAAGVEAERIQTERRLRVLLSMQRQLLDGNPEDAYRPLLVHALQLIPGAESGSLLVLEGKRFRYAAAVTFDEGELGSVTFSIEETRDGWYGLGLSAWQRGVPRILRGPSLQVQASGFQRGGVQHGGVLPSVHSIASTIGVPILHHGEVYAFLNIDSHTDPDAFGKDSVEVAASFATQAALLLHEAWQRRRVWQAARTDVLTGLPNRRAFTEQLAQEAERSGQENTPLSLLIGDLAQFKAINDAAGHMAGDAALVEVAEVLCRCAPPGTQAFRWAGDEFALLLPGITLEQAEVVKAQITAELSGRFSGAQPLRLTMGAAQLSSGDPYGHALLQAADAAMYTEKRRHSRSYDLTCL